MATCPVGASLARDWSTGNGANAATGLIPAGEIAGIKAAVPSAGWE